MNFSANGTAYVRTFPPPGLPVGATVLVRYYPKQPYIATLEEPRTELLEKLAFSGIVGVTLGAMLLAILCKWLSDLRMLLREMAARFSKP